MTPIATGAAAPVVMGHLQAIIDAEVGTESSPGDAPQISARIYTAPQRAEICERADICRHTLSAAIAGEVLRRSTRRRLIDALLALDLEPPPRLVLTAGERQAFERRLVGSLSGSNAHGA